MVVAFFRFVMNDGLYWIAMLMALLAISISDNKLKSTLFPFFNAPNSYELVYFDI